MEDLSGDRWYLGAGVEDFSGDRWYLGARILMRRAQSPTPLASSFLGEWEARNFDLRLYFITGFRVSFMQNRGQIFPSQAAVPPRSLCLKSNNESSVSALLWDIPGNTGGIKEGATLLSAAPQTEKDEMGTD